MKIACNNYWQIYKFCTEMTIAVCYMSCGQEQNNLLSCKLHVMTRYKEGMEIHYNRVKTQNANNKSVNPLEFQPHHNC